MDLLKEKFEHINVVQQGDEVIRTNCTLFEEQYLVKKFD